MRIAIIMDGLVAGGAERQALWTTAMLQQRGHDARLITWGTNKNDFQDMIARNDVRVVPMAADYPWKPRRLRGLVKYLRRERFDVVHAFKGGPSIYGCLAARWAGTPCVFAGYRAQVSTSAWRRWLIRRTTAKVSGWIVNSHAIGPVVARDFRVAPGRIYVVHNLIASESFQTDLTRQEARARLGLPTDIPIVVMVANVLAIKNYPMFVRTARTVRDAGRQALFLAAGRHEAPELQRQLESLTAELGVQSSLRFLGLCREVPALLRACDVFVLTSNSEGLPNALLEASFAGLPCVSTANGGAEDIIVDGQTGFLVPVNDHRSMADRVAKLLADPEQAARIGQAARCYMKKTFSPEAIVDRLVALYESCLRNAARKCCG